MQLSHRSWAVSAVFDEPNLVSAAGLVPVLALAEAAGLARLAGQQLTVPTDKGANAGRKVASLVAGMVAGADSIDDLGLLRHGGMGRVLSGSVCAVDVGIVPAGLQVRTCPPARRGRCPLVDRTGRSHPDTHLPPGQPRRRGGGDRCRRHHRGGPWLCQAGRRVRLLQGARAERAAGHSGYPDGGAGDRGTAAAEGVGGSPRGAQRLVADAAAQVRRLLPGSRPLLRADSAFYGRGPVGAAIRGGCDVWRCQIFSFAP